MEPSNIRRMRTDNGEDELIMLIKAHQAQFYRIAYSYVKNEQDALDVVQEAIVKAIGKSDQITERAFIKSWFIRILINCAIDHTKRMKHVEISEEIATNVDASEIEALIDLRAAMATLEPEHKTILELRYFEDLPLQEIAEVVKQPLSTVKSTLYRTLKKLKLKLEEGEVYES